MVFAPLTVSDGIRRTGYDEVTLTSLSTADFSGIEDLVRDVIEDPEHGQRVSVSLPSLRVDAFSVGTAAQIQRVRRTGLTFAPEGGTWRIHSVRREQVLKRMEPIRTALPELWPVITGIIDDAYARGWIKN